MKKITDSKIDQFLKPEFWRKDRLFYLLNKPRVKRKDNSAFNKCVAMYLSYHEVFEGTSYNINNETELINNMQEFNFNNLLEILAKLNFFLSPGYYRKDTEELVYAKQLFPDSIYKKIEKLWHSGRKIFFRHQLLSLIKLNIMKNNLNSNKKLVKDDIYSFGRLMIRVNDFIENDYFEERGNISNKEKKDFSIANIVRNLELNSIQQFKYTLPRYWTIYFDCFERASIKYPGEVFNIHEEFKEATGLDLKLFILLGLTIFIHYKSRNKKFFIEKPNEFFINQNKYFEKVLPNIRNIAPKIFSILSSTRENYVLDFTDEDRKSKKFYLTFQPIYRKPLLKLNNNHYLLLDVGFLENKLTFGIYHEINECLLKKKRNANKNERIVFENKRNNLNAFLGRCIEIYTNDLFHRLYDNNLTKVLYSDIDGDDTGGVDFIIYYPDILLFIEVTASSLRHKTILAANFNNIEKEIKDIFFSNSGRKSKGKIYQLDSSILLFNKGKLKDLKINPKSIKKIYPILILEKGLPDIPPILEKYRKYFREKGLLKGYEENFQCIDIEELELLESLVKDKGITLPSIFEDKKNSQYWDWPLKNYLYFNKNTDLSHNKYLNKQLNKFFNFTTKRLFGKSEDI